MGCGLWPAYGLLFLVSGGLRPKAFGLATGYLYLAFRSGKCFFLCHPVRD